MDTNTTPPTASARWLSRFDAALDALGSGRWEFDAPDVDEAFQAGRDPEATAARFVAEKG